MNMAVADGVAGSTVAIGKRDADAAEPLPHQRCQAHANWSGSDI